MNDGRKIVPKDPIDYEKNPNLVIPVPLTYEPSTQYEPGTAVNTLSLPIPPRGSHGMPIVANEDLTLNVNNYGGNY